MDEWRGLSVYGSDDLDTWQRQGMILHVPGQHPDDRDVGRHTEVVTIDDSTAYIFYFTHPGEAAGAAEDTWERRRSSIHAALLTVEEGQLLCHRDRSLQPSFLSGG